MLSRAAIVFLLACCGALTGAAAPVGPQPQLRWKNIAVDWPADITVQAVSVQDNGHIYIASSKGLYIFDGSRVYKPPALASDYISSILHVGTGLLLGLGTGYAQVSLPADHIRKHTRLPFGPDTVSSFCQFYDLDAWGNISFFTGYNRAAQQSWNLHTRSLTRFCRYSTIVAAVHKGGDGRLDALLAVEPTGFVQHRLAQGKVINTLFLDGLAGRPAVRVSGMCRGASQDTVWCTSDKGLFAFCFSSSDYHFYPIDFGGAALHGLAWGAGKLYVAGSRGIFVLNAGVENAVPGRLHHRPDDGFSLAADPVLALTVWRDKLLVAITTKGVSVAPLEPRWQPVYTWQPEEGGAGAGATSLFAGEDQLLYQHSGRLYALDKQTLAVRQSWTFPHLLRHAQYTGPGQWLALADDGAFRLGDAGIRPLLKQTDKSADAFRQGSFCVRDPARPCYWIGGENGLVQWNDGEDALKAVPDIRKEAYQRFVGCIPQGDGLWLHAAGSYLRHFNRSLQGAYGADTMLLTYNDLNDWCATGDRRYLLACSNGLWRFDASTLRYGNAAPALNTTVFRIFPAGRDTLLAAQDGFYAFAKGVATPLPSPFADLWRPASGNGFALRDTDAILVAGDQWRVLPLRGPQADSDLFYLSINSGAGPLQLRGDSASFTAVIRAWSLVPDAEVRVSYRLLPDSRSWQPWPGGPLLFERLGPGDYRLEAKSEVGGRVFQSKALVIRVVPVYYQTWWFRGLLAALALAAVALVFFARIRVIRRKALARIALERRMNELEQTALRAQMNPHFLFNTLNSINNFILTSDNRRASHYLTRFSKLVRLVLDMSRKPLIPLSKELEIAGYYLDLEQMRLNGSFTYAIADEANAESWMVPPLLLQPFAENAVWHGMKGEGAGNAIRIEAREGPDEALLIVIEDNGPGIFTSARTKEPGSATHQSFAMGATEERLRLQHPANRLAIEELADEHGHARGTRISLTLYP